MIAARMASGLRLSERSQKPSNQTFATADPDREEDAGDIACLVFGHAEHAGSLEERRQQIEHEVVFAGRDLEPLRRVWLAG
jgi:hypothetical protein